MKQTITFLLALGFILFESCGKKVVTPKDQWPQFRGNNYHTGYSVSKGPETLNKLIWKFETKGKVFSSPVLLDGTVYFGSSDNHLYAVDVKTGQEIWKFETEREVRSSPALSDSTVYFGSADNHLYAVDIETGQEKWKFKTESNVGSGPALSDGTVYFGSDDNHLYAVDIETGQKKWKFKTESNVRSSPALSDGTVYFGSADNHLYAVDIETGQEKWRFKTENRVFSSPALSDGTVYFGSIDNHLYAVDIETGQEKWKFETKGKVFSSPALSDGTVYFGSADNHLYAVDIETGQEKWRFETEGWVTSSPALSDGTVYFGSNDNSLYALDIQTGQEKWKFKIEGILFSGPALVNGIIYFGSHDGNLYAVNELKEELTWDNVKRDNKIKGYKHYLNAYPSGKFIQKAKKRIDSIDSRSIEILYPSWAAGIAFSHLAKVVLEEEGYEVRITPLEPGPIYASLAKGNADVMMDAWLPHAHSDYWKKYGKDLNKIGEAFSNGTTGLAVPDYVDIESIPELNKHVDEFDGRILGIGSGTDIHRNTEKAIKEYDLDYKQITSSSPAMMASLKRAYKKREPIIITGWKPHHIWTNYELKYLEDPKGVFTKDVCAILARQGFKNDYPVVYKFFTNFNLSEKALYDLMDVIDQSNDELEAARRWYNNHKNLVESWMP